MSETVESRLADLFDDITIKVDGLFGNQNSSSANGQTHIHSKITGITAHNLNDRATLMRLHGITELIDAFDGSVSSGIKADTVIGAADIVVNGGRNTDDIDTVFA